MTIPEKAVKWAVDVANDPAHGYDQTSRWGPDYDCSSLIISAYKTAGVPLTCTNTSNMRGNMLDNGFRDVTGTVNLVTGAGLQPGDVLLHETRHTVMSVGNGQIVHARENESGGATGGHVGDQTGREILVSGYYNFPWDYVLRYTRKEDAAPPQSPTGTGTYTVKAGDTLWDIAEKFLGKGWKWHDMYKANNMTSTSIYPGQVLKIPDAAPKVVTITVTVKETTFVSMQKEAENQGITIGGLLDLTF